MPKTCPTCRQSISDQAASCPFCGTSLAGVASSGGSTDVPQPASPIPNEQTGPFSSPPGMLPVIGSRTRRAAIFLVALAVIAGVGALIYFVTPQVRRGLNGLTHTEPMTTPLHITVPDLGVGGSGKAGHGAGHSDEYTSAKAVFQAMKDGAPCARYDDVVNTTVVSAGVCYAGTEVWTIQVFLDDFSYDAVVSNYVANDTIHVAYGGNWTVLTQSKASSKKIAKALDGRGK